LPFLTRPFILLAVVGLAAPAVAAERDYPYHGLAAELGMGVSAPVADKDYKNYADASFKLTMHAGWEFPVLPILLIAPELSFDFVPVNTNDGTFQNRNLDASFQRYRVLFGGRLALRFGRVTPFLRLAFGVDHVTGKITAPFFGVTSYSSTAFGFEPALGVHVEVVKYFVVGAQVSFPVAAHDFGKTLGTSVSFTAFDIDFTGTAGVRW
jgi:hypothetical protein